MRYRFPLELELAILELAAPALSIDRLHDRVDYFLNVSLVHRSLTAWAQDRLRDQFLYTYQPRPDEHKRLKQRFEAGFGPDRTLRRLYLDCTRLPTYPDKRTEPGTDSVSVTYNGYVCGPISRARGPGGPEQAGTSAQEEACEAVAHYVQNDAALGRRWRLCAMIRDYGQKLYTLWIKLPMNKLDIADLPPPRVLLVDDAAFGEPCCWCGLLPVSSKTLLRLRYFVLDIEGETAHLDAHHLVLDKCWWADSSATDLLVRFHQLETVVLYIFDTSDDDFVRMLASLPTTIRRVHVIEHNFYNQQEPLDARHVLPQLESFTYTLLSSGESALHTPADDEPEADAPTEIQQAVESIIDAPQCTFEFLRSTKSPEDALANALAALKLDL